jgi:glycosyltransferase involved in cell wall biosynthesis
LHYTPLRFSSALKSHIVNEWFDWNVARMIEEPIQSIMGFAGKSLRTFQRSIEMGASELELISATSHVDNVSRLHARSAEDSGIADSWLNSWQQQKSIREYEVADRIYIHSEYVRESFLEAGIAQEKLVRTYLKPDPRFRPPSKIHVGDTFRIVYVGSVVMTKGIHLLLDAFDQVSIPNRSLRIVGGWSTRAVRQFMENRCRHSSRITVSPGDPLPALHEADVLVHPSYQDGLGYAPMEALACGVPVIVTEDTGMKEYVQEGVNGFIIPTGSTDAIVAALERLARNPLVCCSSLLPDHEEVSQPAVSLSSQS